MRKKLIVLFTVVIALFCMGSTECNYTPEKGESLNGGLADQTYKVEFFDNSGRPLMHTNGTNIEINPEWHEELDYTEDGYTHRKALSSIIAIVVDGRDIRSCGSTVLFIQNDLNPVIDFTTQEVNEELNDCVSKIDGGVVVLIQSQEGDPIYAFAGSSVNYSVCRDLPKTTLIEVDGKVIYIHRANFQIIEKGLLSK